MCPLNCNMNRFKKYGLAVLLGCFLAMPFDAWANHRYFFRDHQSGGEESKMQAVELHSGSNGLLWITTDKGLAYYDGNDYFFVPFADSGTSHALLKICESPDGNLFVSNIRNELFEYRNGALHRMDIWPDSSRPRISDLLFDTQGALWIATAGRGLFRYFDKKLENFKTPFLCDDYVNVLLAKGRQIFVGTDNGLCILTIKGDSIASTSITYEDGLPDYIVSAIAPASDSNIIWLGFQAGGVCSLHLPDFKIINRNEGSQRVFGEIKDIIEYQKGILWVADEANGLLERIERKGKVFYNVIRPVSDIKGQRITDLEKDNECNIWMLSNEEGLISTDGQIALPELLESDHNAQKIIAVHVDSEGIVWYSTQRGLYRYDPGIDGKENIRFIGIARKNQNELIISIFSSGPGILWLGTFGNGLYCYHERTGKLFHFTEKDGLVNNNILSIAGSGNEIWLATLGGAARVRINREVKSKGDAQFSSFTTSHGLSSNYIYEVHPAKDGSIWFASDGRGITRLKDGKLITFDRSNGLKSDVIISVSEDSKGRIWFATPLSGIYSYDGDTLLHYTKSSGLRELRISSIQVDQFDHVVIVHEKGIDILDPEKNHVSFPAFNPVLDILESDLNCRSVGPDGKIWIGATEGLIIYSPLSGQCRNVPATILTEVMARSQAVDFKNDHVLPYSRNYLAFRFKGLWYKNPDQVEYQYKLEGFDRDWHLTSDKNALYPALHPGRYVFKVRSSIDGHFENLPIEQYAFRIAPPFWQTPWFIIGLLLFIIGSIYSYVRFREERLKAIEHLEKEKIDFQLQTLRSQVNPHFLFNSFNTLLNMIDLDRKGASEYVQRMSDFFRNILTFKEKELILLTEELRILDDYYYLQEKRFGSNFHIIVNIDRPDQYCIPPMTLQLLVENALKHNIISKAKPLTVEIFIENERMVVRNNLQPKRQAEQSTRVGLSNIINRYRMLFGVNVEVYSDQKYFTILLPLIKC